MPKENTSDNRVPHELRLKTASGMATLRLLQKGRRFDVTGFEVDGRPELSLAFDPKGGGVENLDDTSDAAQCFGVSTKVKIDGVFLSASEMKASCIEELSAALKKVKLRTYNAEEI